VRRLVRTLVVATTIWTGVVAGGASPAVAGAGCDASFHVITTPNAASGDTQLGSVAAWNTSNAWAVGLGGGQGFSVHWNGTTWSQVAVPVIGQQTVPSTVVMAGPHDIWSFGGFKNSQGKFRTLALHKTNGPWTRITTPNLGTGENDLFTASVISPNDIWAGGNGTVGGVTEIVIAHWNGIKWKKFTVPAIGTGDNFLEGLTAAGPGDVWITLTYPDANTGNDRATTYHRVGSSWHRVNFAQPSTNDVEPRDMVALSPTQIWLAGFYVKGAKELGLIERYNGSHWTRFPIVNPDPRTFLEHIAPLGPHDIYVVGGSGSHAFAEHYDGASWQQVTTHDPAGATANQLNGAAAASSGPNDTRIWGVGLTQQQPSDPRRSLIEQSCP
jgi:hypothetical protein